MAKIACNGVIFSEIEAIFFDKDGTLEDSRSFLEELAQERIQQVALTVPNFNKKQLLLALGIREKGINPKGLMAVGSRQENELATAAYVASSGYDWFTAKDIVQKAFDRAAEKVFPTKQSSPIFDGSLRVIQSLAANQIKLGIISADSTEGINAFTKREKIDDYFQLVLGSNSSLSKPDPKFYLEACKKLNVPAKNTLMVGDSLGDIQMAQQAGAAGTIGISWHDLTNNHLDLATVIIDDLTAIQIII